MILGVFLAVAPSCVNVLVVLPVAPLKDADVVIVAVLLDVAVF